MKAVIVAFARVVHAWILTRRSFAWALMWLPILIVDLLLAMLFTVGYAPIPYLARVALGSLTYFMAVHCFWMVRYNLTRKPAP